MSKRKKALEIAAPYFEGVSKHEKLYVTSDSQVFSVEHQADGHAQRLKDHSVEIVTKADVETFKIIAAAEKAAADKEAKKQAAIAAEIEAERQAGIEAEKAEAAKIEAAEKEAKEQAAKAEAAKAAEIKVEDAIEVKAETPAAPKAAPKAKAKAAPKTKK